MKIVKQLLKEFWIPLLGSTVWLLFNIFGNSSKKNLCVKDVLTLFAPAFFFISWLTGQIFRVIKQSKVEENFSLMDTRFNKLLLTFEKKTNEMICNLTGGDSFTYFAIGSLNSNTNTGILTAIHVGEYPHYDVTARILDLQKFEKIKSNPTLENLAECSINIDLGILTHGLGKMFEQPWNVEHENKQSYNVTFTARNGSYSQKIRLKKVNGKWQQATKVFDRQKRVLHEEVASDYPKDEEGNVTWDNA
ncbi:MAG: hypothetical protein HQK88_04740 [Nitrospirae bacterium]|nr:hypothetical protein [Nitrospirota bacterium]MBF0533952.1 hypothetical protein [Nitrospirota bacterium]MBF0616111.1 hypothetical protein [Nitrospirota bacterium]